MTVFCSLFFSRWPLFIAFASARQLLHTIENSDSQIPKLVSSRLERDIPFWKPCVALTQRLKKVLLQTQCSISREERVTEIWCVATYVRLSCDCGWMGTRKPFITWIMLEWPSFLPFCYMIDSFGSTWKSKTKRSHSEKQMADHVIDAIMVDVPSAAVSSHLWRVCFCAFSWEKHILIHVHAARYVYTNGKEC
jgi:hypothetical protein